MIGMAMAKQLDLAKDEVDVDVHRQGDQDVARRPEDAADRPAGGGDRAGFPQKMQAKQIAKMMADAKTNLAQGDAFLAKNAKAPGVQTTASGLEYQVITEGKGAKPQPTDMVQVNYKGTLLDGKTFDSSYDRGEPATFPLNQVVPGWQEGIAMMPVGSKYKFWIPAKLGLRRQGHAGRSDPAECHAGVRSGAS